MIKLEFKEFLRLEKSQNIKKKSIMMKYLEKSQLLIIMQLNISDNTSHNTSQKKKLNTLPEKEKLKNINISQLKDKLSIIQKLH